MALREGHLAGSGEDGTLQHTWAGGGAVSYAVCVHAHARVFPTGYLFLFLFFFFNFIVGKTHNLKVTNITTLKYTVQ